MAASNEDDAISKLTQHIEDLSTNSNIILAICANCGKEGDNLNKCNKCDLAVYCNSACKKKHRTKHKKKCERRAAELAAELHDIKLYKQPAPNEDCPICMLPLPSLVSGRRYKSCCGKVICSGCIHAVRIISDGVSLCPFCRTPTPTSYREESNERYGKRAELDDAEAIFDLGCGYYNGMYGLRQDYSKALELWHRAAGLGHAPSHYNIGCSYDYGRGVERDMKKAIHHYELAAMGGDVMARHNLGCSEGRVGNHDSALKHFMIAAGGGETESLSAIQDMFKKGVATKEDFTQALRVYQAYLAEIKSAQRDKAAASDEINKYY